MVEVNGCLHPLEGIILAGVMFALYYWVIRLRCRARISQAFIIVAVLAVTLATFTSLSVMVETDKHTYVNQIAEQVAQPQPAPMVGTADNPMRQNDTLPAGASDISFSWLQHQGIFTLLLYAGGVVVVLLGFFVQMLWYWRMRRKSQRDTEEGDVEVFTAPCGTPFSFFNSVFLPSGLDGDVRRYALIHEKCHIRHRHFFKLCLMLVFVALHWFNPFVWMNQKG